MQAGAGERRRRRTLLLRSSGSAAQPLTQTQSTRPEFVLRSERSGELTICVEEVSRRVLRRIPVEGPCFRIGSSPHNELCLNHPQIEPRHAAVFSLDGGLYLCALSPTAEINSARGGVIADWWIPAEQLQIGPFRLHLEGDVDHPPRKDPRLELERFEHELSRPAIQFRNALHQTRTWPIRRSLTLIGSSELCDWQLDDPSVMPVHAAIVWNSASLSLIDLSGSQDTFLNGHPVPRVAPLDVGDDLRFGQISGQVQSPATWESAASSPAEVHRLVQELKRHHQQMLELHQSSLEQIESLLSDPSGELEPLQDLLHQMERSYRSMGGAPGELP